MWKSLFPDWFDFPEIEAHDPYAQSPETETPAETETETPAETETEAEAETPAETETSGLKF